MRGHTISSWEGASWSSCSNERGGESCSPPESIWTWNPCPSCSSPNASWLRRPSWSDGTDPLESQVQALPTEPEQKGKKKTNIVIKKKSNKKNANVTRKMIFWNIPWALRIRKILLPVTLLTCAIPWESRRITPIWDGVIPLFANLQMFSSTYRFSRKKFKK